MVLKIVKRMEFFVFRSFIFNIVVGEIKSSNFLNKLLGYLIGILD